GGDRRGGRAEVLEGEPDHTGRRPGEPAVFRASRLGSGRDDAGRDQEGHRRRASEPDRGFPIAPEQNKLALPDARSVALVTAPSASRKGGGKASQAGR